MIAGVSAGFHRHKHQVVDDDFHSVGDESAKDEFHDAEEHSKRSDDENGEGKDRQPGEEEGEENFHDTERTGALDIQAFGIVHPISDRNVLHLPMWTASVQGVKRNGLRAADQRHVNQVPMIVKEAVLHLRDVLDPLDMDEPLPTLSPSWFRIIGNAFTSLLNNTWFRLISYWKREWHHFLNDLEELRERDIPGYQSPISMQQHDVNDDADVIAILPVPECLPSMANLEKLLIFNKFAREYGWYATLVRVERKPPGSKVIGFRIQLTRLPDHVAKVKPSEDSDLAFHEVLLLRHEESERRSKSIIEDNSVRRNARDSSNHNGNHNHSITGPGSLSSSVPADHHDTVFAPVMQHMHLAAAESSRVPPLLLYSIDGQPDMLLSAKEILSFASTLGIFGLKDS